MGPGSLVLFTDLEEGGGRWEAGIKLQLEWVWQAGPAGAHRPVPPPTLPRPTQKGTEAPCAGTGTNRMPQMLWVFARACLAPPTCQQGHAMGCTCGWEPCGARGLPFPPSGRPLTVASHDTGSRPYGLSWVASNHPFRPKWRGQSTSSEGSGRGQMWWWRGWPWQPGSWTEAGSPPPAPAPRWT